MQQYLNFTQNRQYTNKFRTPFSHNKDCVNNEILLSNYCLHIPTLIKQRDVHLTEFGSPRLEITSKTVAFVGTVCVTSSPSPSQLSLWSTIKL